jgi:hypothetical protein
LEGGKMNNLRLGKYKNKFYYIGGMKYYKYSYSLNGKVIITLKEIHQAIKEEKEIFQFDKLMNEWKKFDYENLSFKSITK